MTGNITTAASDPQAADWGGLRWSEWQDFDEAHRGHVIPATPGLYRFRARGEPGLLYIGESGDAGGRRARLDDLARGRKRHPPEFYLNWRAAGLALAPAPRSLCRPVRPSVRGRRVPCRGLVGTGGAPGQDGSAGRRGTADPAPPRGQGRCPADPVRRPGSSRLPRKAARERGVTCAART